MKTTLTFIGKNYNKLLAEPNEQLQKMADEARRKNTKDDALYTTPKMDEYVNVTFDNRMSKLIKYGEPQQVIIKLAQYDFINDKGVRTVGCYFQLVGVLSVE